MFVYKLIFRDLFRHVEAELFFLLPPDAERALDALRSHEICGCPCGRAAFASRYAPALRRRPGELEAGRHGMPREDVRVELGRVEVR